MKSYDVTALFTSVPVDLVLGIIKGLLGQDITLKERDCITSQGHMLLLGFCLHNTYFSLQVQFYEQVEGVAMRSPVIPKVANLCTEYFEQKALNSVTHPPGYGLGMWMTLLSSRRKKINKSSLNTLIVFTQP